MMKKNGFTLAEVLITLAIIGVVATMTLPALITNTGEQQYKTGLKKGINTFTEVAQMSKALDGIDYSEITSEATDDSDDAGSLFGVLFKRAQVDAEREIPTGFVEGTNHAVFFRDGSALIYEPSETADEANAEKLDDGYVRGFGVIYDTNGAKKPNTLSNCEGKVRGANSDTDDITACEDKKNRAINDRFSLKFRGSLVVPSGAAARWAFEQ